MKIKPILNILVWVFIAISILLIVLSFNIDVIAWGDIDDTAQIVQQRVTDFHHSMIILRIICGVIFITGFTFLLTYFKRNK